MAVTQLDFVEFLAGAVAGFAFGLGYARREYLRRLDSVVRALQADPEVIGFFDEMSKKRGAGRCRS